MMWLKDGSILLKWKGVKQAEAYRGASAWTEPRSFTTTAKKVMLKSPRSDDRTGLQYRGCRPRARDQRVVHDGQSAASVQRSTPTRRPYGSAAPHVSRTAPEGPGVACSGWPRHPAGVAKISTLRPGLRPEGAEPSCHRRHHTRNPARNRRPRRLRRPAGWSRVALPRGGGRAGAPIVLPTGTSEAPRGPVEDMGAAGEPLLCKGDDFAQTDLLLVGLDAGQTRLTCASSFVPAGQGGPIRRPALSS